MALPPESNRLLPRRKLFSGSAYNSYIEKGAHHLYYLLVSLFLACTTLVCTGRHFGFNSGYELSVPYGHCYIVYTNTKMIFTLGPFHLGFLLQVCLLAL